MKKIKNKKVVLALVLLLGIAASFAYYTTTDSFENIFKTSKYGTKVEEVFESPDDWTPGDETSKTVIATNTGDVCENVRVSYTEKWTSENGNDLPLVDPTLNEKIAIINFDNTNDWKQKGNYYYYNKNLLKNESTTSFMKSVTYNPNYATSGMTCTSTTEGNKTTKECSTGNDSYAGATYKLTITVETIQCDAMESEWGVSLNDLKPYTIVSGDLDTVGSVVKIANEEFYVIGKEGNKVKMLAKWNLKVGDIFDNEGYGIGKYLPTDAGYGLQAEMKKSAIPFITEKGYWDKNECYLTIESLICKSSCDSNDFPYYENGVEICDRDANGLKNNYVGSYSGNPFPYVYDSNSYLFTYVENYVTYLKNQGIDATGRLISSEELEELGCDRSLSNCSSAPSWVYSTDYWSGTPSSEWHLIAVQTNGYIDGAAGIYPYEESPPYGLRPVIILEP